MVTISSIFWDPNPVLWKVPGIGLPILWYGAIFAAAFALGFPIFVRLLSRWTSHEKAIFLADRIVLYVVLATVIGARLGHFVFYEKPSSYLLHPWEFFLPPYAGLASHGALIAIPIALYLFVRRYRASLGDVTWLRLLDLISVPTALVGAWIRVGNFVNQEILGTPTSLPWGVVFGHPADRSPIVARHPVQLYEAVAYLAVFCVLWFWSMRKDRAPKEGEVFGLFLVLVFGFRLLFEHWKVEQSHLMPFGISWTMGQLLSIPGILVGLFLLFRTLKRATR